MNPGRLCQIVLKSDKEISGYSQLAQHVIFAYHMLRQTPLIALPALRFPGCLRAKAWMQKPQSGGKFLVQIPGGAHGGMVIDEIDTCISGKI